MTPCNSVRIVSFSPSATELVCALGHHASLVGISHACDYPRAILDRPRVSTSRVPDAAPMATIDACVQTAERLYDIDHARLASLRPDVVITQRQCTVCAVGENDVNAALTACGRTAHVVALAASRFDEFPEDVRRVADALDTCEAANGLLAGWQTRIDTLRARPRVTPPPRVLALSWFAPLMTAGHWVTDMIAAAGGLDQIRPREAISRRITFDDIVAYAPAVIVLMPCGVSMPRAIHDWKELHTTDPWRQLEAVRTRRVFAVDGGLFHRPGPRLIDGIELLASLLDAGFDSPRLPATSSCAVAC